MKNKHLILIPLVASGILSACAPTVSKHGNLVEEHQLEEIVEGIHTRKDVLRIMGSPTTVAPFDDKTWYYIGQITEKHGILDPEVTEEKIYIVQFDEQGTVNAVQHQDQERVKVPISKDSTPTHGKKLTVIQQALGNVGKFNTEEF